MRENQFDFCKCEKITAVGTGFEDSFGYWDVCVKCGKRLEDGHHYYNHFDGEDHIEYWDEGGDVYMEGNDYDD